MGDVGGPAGKAMVGWDGPAGCERCGVCGELCVGNVGREDADEACTVVLLYGDVAQQRGGVERARA